MMHSGTTDFLKILAVFAFVGVAVWWLESRFDALVAVLVVGTIVGAVFFAAGAFLSHAISRSTMQNLTKFADSDAQTDRYRMQSFKSLAQGDAAMQRAAAQLTVLDAKRVDALAQQRARAIAAEQRQLPAPADLWGMDDDNVDAQSGATFQVWE